MAFLNLFSTQTTEMKSLDEKFELQSVRTAILQSLANPEFCSCFFRNRTFNYTSKAWNQFPNDIAMSFDTSCNPIGTAILRIGEPLPGSRLTPTAMSLQSINEMVAGSGEFTAKLQISFDQSQLVRSRKDLTLPFAFKVRMSDPVSSRSVQACSASGFIVLPPPPPPPPAPAPTPAASSLLSGCQICVQCANHDQEGAYRWVEGPVRCIPVNGGLTDWSEAMGTGDENTGGIRCRTSMSCP